MIGKVCKFFNLDKADFVVFPLVLLIVLSFIGFTLINVLSCVIGYLLGGATSHFTTPLIHKFFKKIFSKKEVK